MTVKVKIPFLNRPGKAEQAELDARKERQAKIKLALSRIDIELDAIGNMYSRGSGNYTVLQPRLKQIRESMDLITSLTEPGQ